MDQWTIILALFFLVVAIIGLIMTLKVMKDQLKAKDEKDHSVPNKIRNHNLLMNPIFLVYVATAVFSIVYILYWLANT